MSHDYNTRRQKESVVSGECLQLLEANIINNINSLKGEIISLKETVKRWQEENERLCDKYQQLENGSYRIFLGSNNLGILGIRDIVQNSDLESVTLILSDINVKVESREVEECHRIGRSNYGSKNIIIRFINRKCRKKALLNRKQ